MNIYDHLKDAEGFRAHPYADGPEGDNLSVGSVSYTHLTLPTILRV